MREGGSKNNKKRRERKSATDSALHHPLFSKLPLVYALLIKGSAKNCPSPTYLPTSKPPYPQPTHTLTPGKQPRPQQTRNRGPLQEGHGGGPNDRQTKRKGHRGGKGGGKNERGSNPSELHWLSGSLWSCYTLCHPDPPPPIASGNYDRDTGGAREGEAVWVNFNWSTGCRVWRSPLGFQQGQTQAHSHRWALLARALCPHGAFCLIQCHDDPKWEILTVTNTSDS